MSDEIRRWLEEFRDQTIRRERKRWIPLYRLLARKERRLRIDREELPDKGARLDAKAQYELLQELIALAPIIEPTPLRPRTARTRRGSAGKKPPQRETREARRGRGSSKPT